MGQDGVSSQKSYDWNGKCVVEALGNLFSSVEYPVPVCASGRPNAYEIGFSKPTKAH